MKISLETDKLALAAAKAALQAAPVAGPMIASLIGDFVHARHQEAQERMVLRLAKRVEEMGSAFNAVEAQADDTAVALHGFVHREEFGKLYARCALAAATSQDELRVNTAAEILANSLVGEENGGLPFNELEHFANCLALLSPDALCVLAEAAEPTLQGQLKDHYEAGDTHFYFRDLAERVPFQPFETMAMVYRLQASFLMYCQPEALVQQPDYRNWVVTITQLGKDLVEHIASKAGLDVFDRK